MREVNTKKTEENQEIGSIDARLDWDQSFFRLMDSIHRSETLPIFRKNIDMLECIMSPYIDDIHGKEVTKAIESFNVEARKFKEKGITNQEREAIEWVFLKGIYSALMRLAFRKKILPQPEIDPKVIG